MVPLPFAADPTPVWENSLKTEVTMALPRLHGDVHGESMPIELCIPIVAWSAAAGECPRAQPTISVRPFRTLLTCCYCCCCCWVVPA